MTLRSKTFALGEAGLNDRQLLFMEGFDQPTLIPRTYAQALRLLSDFKSEAEHVENLTGSLGLTNAFELITAFRTLEYLEGDSEVIKKLRSAPAPDNSGAFPGTIAVPTKGRPHLFRQCLLSIVASLGSRHLNRFVAVDDSRDRVREQETFRALHDVEGAKCSRLVQFVIGDN